MKKKLTILSFFVFLSVVTLAQQLNTNTGVSPDNVIKAIPAKVFSQFVQSALKPTSFSNSFAKEKKILLKNIETNTPAQLAKKIAVLAAQIKPAMFKSSFSLTDITSRSSTIKTMPEAIGLLKEIEVGVKPEATAGIWALQRNGWLSDINKLK